MIDQVDYYMDFAYFPLWLYIRLSRKTLHGVGLWLVMSILGTLIKRLKSPEMYYVPEKYSVRTSFYTIIRIVYYIWILDNFCWIYSYISDIYFTQSQFFLYFYPSYINNNGTIRLDLKKIKSKDFFLPFKSYIVTWSDNVKNKKTAPK